MELFLSLFSPPSILDPFEQSIRLSDLSEIYQLDSGSTSKVYSVLYKKRRYALKVIPQTHLKLDEIPEIQHLALLIRCCYIARMIGFFEERDLVCILFELYEQNLEMLTQSSDYFLLSLETKLKIFRQIVLAVRFCHEKGVCHLDLKLSNIMIDSQKRVRLIDFGCSRKEGSPYQVEMTPYSSPEIVLNKKLAKKEMDIWALGVILFRMVTNKYPFATPDEILNSRWNPELVPSKLNNLFFSIFNQENRATTVQILYFLDTHRY